MKLYHYTTIDALALILKNKTIKFSRLDRVDDLEEGRVESSGVKLGKHFFVSCWTENADESIPLWKMYSADSYGVRICLEKDMFKCYNVPNGTVNGVSVVGDNNSIVPPEDLFNNDYMLFPIAVTNDDSFFCKRVQYVEDVIKETSDVVKIIKTENDTAEITLQLGKVGLFKHKRWAFQEETRFVLSFLPINPFKLNPELVSQAAANAYLSNAHVNFDRYYLHLKDDVFDDLVITLSPMATEGQKIIVEQLCSAFAPTAVIKESSLGNLIKLK